MHVVFGVLPDVSILAVCVHRDGSKQYLMLTPSLQLGHFLLQIRVCMQDLYSEALRKDRLHCSGCQDKILKHKQQNLGCPEKSTAAAEILKHKQQHLGYPEKSTEAAGVAVGASTASSPTPRFKLWRWVKLKGYKHSKSVRPSA